jgi:DNA-binding MarR family transcriptional regulator
MPPKEQKLLRALELLTMLYDARQQFPRGLSEEEKATLKVTKQLLDDAGLTIPEFTNQLKKLSKRGYLWHFVIFDDVLRAQIDAEIDSKQTAEALTKLEEKDTKELSDKIKAESIASLNKIAPTGKELVASDYEDEFVKISEVSKQGLAVYKSLRPDEMALILVYPFRSLHRLHEKMDAGMKFEEVQDTNIWYDSINHKLHVGTAIFNTGKKGSPTRVHHILNGLFSDKYVPELVIDFTDVQYFEGYDGTVKENKRHYLSMHNFLKTNGKLRDIFINHSDRLEINPKYKDSIN